MNYIKRQKKLIALVENNSLEALLIRKRQNIAYLTGTRGEEALLFICARKKFLITDSRYKEEYAKSLKGCELVMATDKNAYRPLEDVCRKTRSRHIGFESNNFPYSEYIVLKKRLKGMTLEPVKGLIESLRMIKDKDELKCIKKACKDSCSIMTYALRSVKEGLSESSVKNRVEEYIIKNGRKRADFDIIIASGRNSSMPHASATTRKIKRGEMVVIDLGTVNYGYNSDLTRTVFLGRIDRKYLRIYNIVLDAQKRAIERIKPGISIKYIDNISREYISKKGLGRYFIHSLGHGIGLETHEEPRISRNSNDRLEENTVITIEPGIYIPGWGGIRIEDVVLVTKNGCEILTSYSKK